MAQATVSGDSASIAFMVRTDWHGQGYATDAAAAVVEHLLASGVRHIGASIGPDNDASRAVARRIGFVNSGTADDDGEERHLLPEE